ncbi:phosphatase PAP2 family protein [Halobacillus seohaensis]|uniref:Phosphatase PAP2 family protein n=1 Tax=Halobacillus seohaensis TaxID=447421 RepID=A0ABW2ENI3_9BACI
MLFSGTKITDFSKTSIIIILIGLIVVGTGTYLFTEIAEEVLEQEKFATDTVASNIVNGIQSPILSNIMGWVTEAGSVAFITIFSIVMFIILLFFVSFSKWVAIYFAISMIGISLLTKGLKLLFGRERPELLDQYDGTGFSFPSGHTTGSAVFYGFMVYLIVVSPLNKTAKWCINSLLIIAVLLISLSRVFLNVHYFTDVLGGLALGFSWLIVCIAALEVMLWRQRK